MQAVSCLAATSQHILSGSDDSNINVWSLARLLELDAPIEAEPDLVLSNHRGAITDLAVGAGINRETNICVSSSRDKTCIVWNYQTGHALRTILFPTIPLCLSIEPSTNAVYVAAEGRVVYLVELFGDKPLIGSQSSEPSSIVLQVSEPLATAEEGFGEINCIATTYDGTSILTGHAAGRILRWSLAPNAPPTELANLNSSVSNLVFKPLLKNAQFIIPQAVVKPNQAQRQHVLTAQLSDQKSPVSRFDQMLNAQGLPEDVVQDAIASFSQPSTEEEENALHVPQSMLATMRASLSQPYLNS